MAGILRKKYEMREGTQPKKSKQVKVRVGKRKVKKTYKQMKQSCYAIDKARLEVQRLQTNLKNRNRQLTYRRQAQGLQPQLIEEMYQAPTNYDVKTIQTLSQANRIKKEIAQINKEYDKANIQITRDLKRVYNLTKGRLQSYELRNRIINNVMREIDEETKIRVRGDVFDYNEKEIRAEITGDPTRYRKKEYYMQERQKLKKSQRNPYWREDQYVKNVRDELEYLEKNIDKGSVADYELQKFKIEFNDLSYDEMMVFVRLNVDNMAVAIFYADPEFVRSNFKEMTGLIQRIKRASRG